MNRNNIPEDELTCARCGVELRDVDYDWVDQEAWCRSCLDERGPTEEDIERLLLEMLYDPENQSRYDVGIDGAKVETFEQACLLTRDRGVVLRLPGGQEFQITVVQSKGAF